jgi:hypothetical protein
MERRNADNQVGNFERVFRKVMSAPKAQVLRREAKEKPPQRGRISQPHNYETFPQP